MGSTLFRKLQIVGWVQRSAPRHSPNGLYLQAVAAVIDIFGTATFAGRGGAMPFRENLLKKIRIDRLAGRVSASLKPGEDGVVKVDKSAMQQLLEMASYRHLHERDLDLYISPDTTRILVLDNELARYATSVEDVALRKSPTLKEMLSIRNAIKILNDSDVVVAKKAESVAKVRDEARQALDLAFGKPDLEALAQDGRIALEIEDTEGVRETLALFADLLAYRPPPPPFAAGAVEVAGAVRVEQSGEVLFGPAVIFDQRGNSLKFMENTLSSLNRSDSKRLLQLAAGKLKAAVEGSAVFQHLKEIAFKKFF